MSRPNVLFVIADDLRPDTIAACDNDVIHTPNLDRIARDGCFLRPYTTEPICVPARAEVLTGGNCFENGCRTFDDRYDPDLVTLPEGLADEGYRTFFSGKWHQDPHPEEAGFDEAHRIVYKDNKNEIGHHTLRFEEEDKEIEGYGDGLITDPAVEFVRDPPEDPWFAYVGYTTPHIPHAPPEEYARMYDPEEIPLPPNFMPEHSFDNGNMVLLDHFMEEYPHTPEMIRQRLADYYAMVTCQDHHVGRLLDALEATGQRDETIVVFTADHGLAVGSHGLLGKCNLYEHSARVPLLIDAPDIREGHRSDALCGHYDFYPTLFDLLGLDVSDTVGGQSYAPVLRGETLSAREWICTTHEDVQRAVTDGRWKLIDYPQIDRTQLFDLATDPHEARNLLAPWRLEFLAQDPERIEAALGPSVDVIDRIDPFLSIKAE